MDKLQQKNVLWLSEMFKYYTQYYNSNLYPFNKLQNYVKFIFIQATEMILWICDGISY